MTRVVMLGVDGLDADLLRVYGPSLPNVRRLMLESPFLELKSTFPPETTTAWATLYTGLNPAHHGVFEFMDEYGQEASQPHKLPVGETFWDIAGNAGKRVCVVNPLLAYPAWPVNGLMLSLPPVGIHGSGPNIVADWDYTHRGGAEEASALETFPPLLDSLTIPTGRHLEQFCHALYTRTARQAELGLKLFTQEPWDLFFLQLDALDYIQHFLWRYSDPSDPAYPGRNPHAGRILEFYRLFDQLLGRFHAHMEKESLLLVVSAYGHGRGCAYKLNLNEWLRNQGHLVARPKSSRLLDRRYLAGRARYRSILLLGQFHLNGIMPHAPRYLPGQPPVSHGSNLIDQQETIAQVVEFTNHSPFGGIKINQANMGQKSYQGVRAEILHNLSQLRLKGMPALNWAKAREDLYQGCYLAHYPDIVFELRGDFGVGMELYGSLLTTNPTHQVISGDHRMQGVLLIGNAHEHLLAETREPVVLDIAPTVLRLLDVAYADRAGQALAQSLQATGTP